MFATRRSKPGRMRKRKLPKWPKERREACRIIAINPIRTLAAGAGHRAHKGLNDAVEVSQADTKAGEDIRPVQVTTASTEVSHRPRPDQSDLPTPPPQINASSCRHANRAEEDVAGQGHRDHVERNAIAQPYAGVETLSHNIDQDPCETMSTQRSGCRARSLGMTRVRSSCGPRGGIGAGRSLHLITIISEVINSRCHSAA
ncbi:Hypothetical protein NGAL_HAMBI490_39450 [Neorhizobium galegae bv. officinalis]|nr:Hypothetical protein NGAL_HAMBI490_39450 [Neorhizobium galegae bv. officinalis]